MSGHGMPNEFAAPAECEHVWEPVSMVFETQLLDAGGRVHIRQPDIQEGRVYFICRGCASHTYMTTQWLGARMHGSEDAIPSGDKNPLGRDGWNRPAWRLPDEDALDSPDAAG